MTRERERERERDLDYREQSDGGRHLGRHKRAHVPAPMAALWLGRIHSIDAGEKA